MSEAARPPRWLAIPAVIGLAGLVLPLLALVLRADFAALPGALAQPQTQDALWLSLRSAAVAVLVCLLLGIPLALAMSRARGWLAGTLRALVTLPLVLPPLVGGLALLSVVGRTGVLGPALQAGDLSIAFTPTAVVLAQTFVSMPFLVIALEGSLRTVGIRYQQAAASLGARPTRVMLTVTLPLVAPSLLAGTVLAFTRALGEFGATAMVAGNRPSETQTIPMAIYTAFNGAGVSQDAAMALSILLIAVALAVLLAIGAVRRPEAL